MVRLDQLWTSTLCLLTISGLLTVGTLPLPEGLSIKQLRSTTHSVFYIPIEIINHKFTAALLYTDSKEYKDMYKDVCALLNGVYNCSNSLCPTSSFYGGVASMTFSPGSVIANTIVVFNSYSINKVVAWALFQRNAENAAPKNLQINMAYTTKDNLESVVLPEPAITTPPTTTTPTPTTTTTQPTTTTTQPTTTTPTPTTTTTTPTTTTPTPTTTTPTPTTTTSNPGNQNDSLTSHGVDPTEDPNVNQTTTVNPHGQTDPQSIGPQTSGGGSDNGSNDWVPGWGIALLVLAAAILLLLIIIFIMMLVRWCCRKTESGQMDTSEDPYYPEKKQLPQEPLPVYSPQAPVTAPVTQEPNSSPVMIGDTPKKNKAGFYAVNP